MQCHLEPARCTGRRSHALYGRTRKLVDLQSVYINGMYCNSQQASACLADLWVMHCVADLSKYLVRGFSFWLHALLCPSVSLWMYHKEMAWIRIAGKGCLELDLIELRCVLLPRLSFHQACFVACCFILRYCLIAIDRQLRLVEVFHTKDLCVQRSLHQVSCIPHVLSLTFVHPAVLIFRVEVVSVYPS